MEFIKPFDKSTLENQKVEDCCEKPEIITELVNESRPNFGGEMVYGVTRPVFKCKNCGKLKLF